MPVVMLLADTFANACEMPLGEERVPETKSVRVAAGTGLPV